MFLIVFNPFHASGLFVYPLKTENQKFSDKFRGNRSYLIRLILEAKFGDEHLHYLQTRHMESIFFIS